jgi:putative ABC transport system permease protein
MAANNLVQDFRVGITSLRRSPRFVCLVLVILSLGIAGNVLIFGLLDALLLRPLPFHNPGQLVQVYQTPWHDRSVRNRLTPDNYALLKLQSRSFQSIAAYVPPDLGLGFNLSGEGVLERVRAAVVSTNFFEVLGVKPQLGRGFTRSPGHQRPNGEAVLSDSLWRKHFGGSREAIGRLITINKKPYFVVGVMPKDFQFPDRPDIWLPGPSHAGELINFLPTFVQVNVKVLARVRKHISFEKAEAEMSFLAAGMQDQFGRQLHVGLCLVPLREDLTGDAQPVIWMLFAAVGFVLLIACADVANLSLVRVAVRRKEIAIRTALGATRGCIFRELLAEGVLLAMLGGFLGLLLALACKHMLGATLPVQLGLMAKINLDWRVAGFAVLISLLAGALGGLPPAIQASRTELVATLKEEGTRTAAELGRGRLRKIFVVSEVSLALVLLLGASLMLKSIYRLTKTSLGFNPHDLWVTELALRGGEYANDAQQYRFYERVLRRVKRIPGVIGAATTSALPLTGNGQFLFLAGAEGSPGWARGREVRIDSAAVSTDYFRAMGIRLIRGRTLAASDLSDSRKVVIIDWEAARRFWPTSDPLGKHLIVDDGGAGTPYEVVGIVNDVRQSGYFQPPAPLVYMPYSESPPDLTVSLVIRTRLAPSAAASSVRRAIWSVDKDEPVPNLQAMQDIASSSLAKQRFRARLLATFAALAIVLAVGGIYGVLSYIVRQRTHEIGVRMAMGARPGHVLVLVVSEGLEMALTGVAIGLAGAVAIGRFMSALLYGVTPTDAGTYVLASLSLLLAAVAAIYIPARRASGVEPMIALRRE